MMDDHSSQTQLSGVPGLTQEGDMIAFAFSVLAPLESLTQRIARAQEIEDRLFPTKFHRRRMWFMERNVFINPSFNCLLRSNLTRLMLFDKLGLISKVTLYGSSSQNRRAHRDFYKTLCNYISPQKIHGDRRVISPFIPLLSRSAYRRSVRARLHR